MQQVLTDEVIFIPQAEQADMLSLDVFDWPHNHVRILLQRFQENIGLKAESIELRNRNKEPEADVTAGRAMGTAALENLIELPGTQDVESLFCGCANPECRQLFGSILLENTQLRSECQLLQAQLAEVTQLAQKLYEQANLGSDTSGIPSSKDWKKNGAAKKEEEHAEMESTTTPEKETPTPVTGYLDNPKGEKRKAGGQPGHAPAFMDFSDAQERPAVSHYPERCTQCPNFETCKENGKFRKYRTARQLDIEVIKICIPHYLYDAPNCPMDNGPIHEEFLEIRGSMSYGSNVELQAVTWHHLLHGSYDRVAIAAKELFDISLSAGTVNAMVERLSTNIMECGFIDASRFFVILFEKVAGADESSAPTAGRTAWVHTVATENITLLIAHWNRGYAGAIYGGVLQFFIYTLISDCWAAYFNNEFRFSNALCDGHILRELVAAAYFRNQKWAIAMFDLLLKTFADKKEAIERGIDSFSEQYLLDLSTDFRQIVADGFAENPGVTQGKTISLLERLKKLECAVLAFASDFSVNFTNNLSEQSLRNLKVAIRVCSQFKTMGGLWDYCIIQSFVDTCRKQGHNPIDMMRLLLSGGDVIEAVFGTEKAQKIRYMIELTDVVSGGDAAAIECKTSEAPVELTEELLAAAAFGRLAIFKDPPPEQTKTSTVPKDKMQAARDRLSRETPISATSPQQDSVVQIRKNDAQLARAAPNSE